MQGISYAIYALTILMLISIGALAFYFFKKPPKDQVDYLTVKELESTGWQLVNEIRNVSDSYIEKLTNQFVKIDEKIEEAKQIERNLSVFNGYDETLLKKKEEIEELLTRFKEEIEIVAIQEQEQVVEEQVVAETVETVQEEKSFDNKKSEIYRLANEGYTVEQISKELNVHSGFVQVIINMNKIRKNS